MRIGIVGNSHIAARRQALSDGLVSLPSAWEVEFWGLPRFLFAKTVLIDGKLAGPKPHLSLKISGGTYSEFPVNDFDILVFEGTRFPVHSWVRDAVSDARGAAYAYLNSCTIFRLACETAALRKAQVYLSPAPLRKNRIGSQGIATPQDFKIYCDLVSALCRSRGFTFLPQPRETLSPAVYTMAEYSDGAVRLENGEVLPDNEVWHMNARYGAALWSQLIRFVDAAALSEQRHQLSNRIGIAEGKDAGDRGDVTHRQRPG